MGKKKFIGERSLVFDWNRLASVLLGGWCLLPLLKALGNLVSFQTGKAVYLGAFYLLGIAGIILAIFKLMDGISTEKSAYFRHFLHERKCDLAFAAFMLWALAACLLSGNTSLALTGSSYRFEGFITLAFYATVYLSGRMLTKRSTKLRVLILYLSAAALSAVIALLGAFPALGNSSSLMLISIRYMFGCAGFDSPAQLGIYLIVTFAVACSLYINGKSTSARIFALLSAVIYVISCAVCVIYLPIYTMLAISIAAAVIYMIKRRKAALAAFAPAGAVVLVCIVLISAGAPFLRSEVFTLVENELDSEYSTISRTELISQSIKLSAKKPLFGYGTDTMLGRYYTDSGELIYHDRPQCEYLQLALSYGIPALIFWLGGVILLLAAYYKERSRKGNAERAAALGLLAYLLAALTGASAATVTVYLLMTAGLCCGTESAAGSDKNEQ